MHLENLSIISLLAIFLVAAIAIWIAGMKLSDTTDILSTRFGIGEAMGGLIILAIVTNLPEIAIVAGAAYQHKMDIAIGNILGGIAIQTVVLVILDRFGLGKASSLTYKAASIVLVLEGTLVIAVLSLVITGHELPGKIIFLRMTPPAILIFIFWVIGIILISKARKDLPWLANFSVPGMQKEPRGHSRKQKDEKAKSKHATTTTVVVVFVICCIVTLTGGVALEMSGDALATRMGMGGVLFGATILAAATALPEISTGLAAIKLKDYQMAVSDIFGGNAFLPVLFLVAELLSGKAILPEAKSTDIYLTALAMLMTIVYIWGLLFRPKKQVLAIGIDSLIVLILYVVGIAGLFIIA